MGSAVLGEVSHPGLYYNGVPAASIKPGIKQNFSHAFFIHYGISFIFTLFGIGLIKAIISLVVGWFSKGENDNPPTNNQDEAGMEEAAIGKVSTEEIV